MTTIDARSDSAVGRKTTDGFELAEELERLWANGEPVDLSRMLHCLSAEHFSALAEDLCAIDLEWRIRRTAQADVSLADECRAISAADYADLLGSLWRNEDCRGRLYETEWLARALWSDDPAAETFATQIGENLTADRLLAALEVVSPLSLTAKRKDKLIQVRCGSHFVVGRQSGEDPEPPAWVDAQRRLVIADRDRLSLSRRQMGVARLCRRRIRVTNLSRTVRIRVLDERLQPGVSAEFDLPLTVQIDDLRLTVVEMGTAAALN